jgi:hypothetical protein
MKVIIAGGRTFNDYDLLNVIMATLAGITRYYVIPV